MGPHGRRRSVEDSVPSRLRYLLTSGFNRFGGRPPRTAVAILRAAIADISDRVRTVALAMCGARTTFGIGTVSYTHLTLPTILRV